MVNNEVGDCVGGIEYIMLLKVDYCNNIDLVRDTF